MWGAQASLEVRRRFVVGNGRPSMLTLVRSAAALSELESDWTLTSYRMTEDKRDILDCAEFMRDCEADSSRMYRLVVVS